MVFSDDHQHARHWIRFLYWFYYLGVEAGEAPSHARLVQLLSLVKDGFSQIF